MYSQEDLKRMSEIIQQHVRPLRYLILFGSYAKGNPDKEG
jgi:predicted nucleotidyltransferase